MWQTLTLQIAVFMNLHGTGCEAFSFQDTCSLCMWRDEIHVGVCIVMWGLLCRACYVGPVMWGLLCRACYVGPVM